MQRRQRLFRFLFNLATRVSLVLCAAMVALWVRSCWTSEMVQWVAPLKRPPCVLHVWAIASATGAIDLYHGRFDYPALAEEDLTSGFWPRHARVRAAEAGWSYRTPSTIDRKSGDGALGFNTRHDQPGYVVPGKNSRWEFTSQQWLLKVPYWFLALITALPAGIIGVRLWRAAAARRRAAGLCPTCGYDLRATQRRELRGE